MINSQTKRLKVTHPNATVKHSCDQCNMEFTSSQQLRNHKRSHKRMAEEEKILEETVIVDTQETSFPTITGK